MTRRILSHNLVSYGLVNCTNPFRYGDVVTGSFFTDRQDELARLETDIRSGQNVVLLSPRRFLQRVGTSQLTSVDSAGSNPAISRTADASSPARRDSVANDTGSQSAPGAANLTLGPLDASHGSVSSRRCG